MRHSTNEIVRGLLSREILEAIARRKPCLVHTQLQPIVQIETVVNLACGRINAGANRDEVLISQQKRVKFENIGGVKMHKTIEDINELRQQSTLRVYHANEGIPVLRSVCARLYDVVGKAFGVNAYLTHGGNRDNDHCDYHHVLISQQYGLKRWPVKDKTNREVVVDVTMSPGDVLYIPMLCWHHPAAFPGEESLHLTYNFAGGKYIDIAKVEEELCRLF